MRNLHEALKANHHLRHYGRLQYLLFLKGIGLPLEESLKFWRTEFSKGSIPVDKVCLLDEILDQKKIYLNLV